MARLAVGVPFIPHITIAGHTDFAVCEQLARDLTPLERLVQGRLETLDLVQISHGIVTTLERFTLHGPNPEP